MTKSNHRYRYTECGLDNVYLLNGFDPVETPRGMATRITNREGLHLAIGRYLVREKRDLNGKELRFLRHELDMTQQIVANMLRVDVQTVARWEKGKTGAVPGAVQGMIRVLYELKTGGDVEVVRLLKELSELDEIIHGDEEATEPLDFEDTEEGWQQSEVVPA
jgi:DNA-binding transcriptional regulator YiaG